MNRILFVCTSNRDRSPALVEYFKKLCPQNEYKSAGVNKYFCAEAQTHLICADDLKWCNVIIFCEEVHFNVTVGKFKPVALHKYSHPKDQQETQTGCLYYAGTAEQTIYAILGCGHFGKGVHAEDYLTRAHYVLEKLPYNIGISPVLKNETNS